MIPENLTRERIRRRVVPKLGIIAVVKLPNPLRRVARRVPKLVIPVRKVESESLGNPVALILSLGSITFPAIAIKHTPELTWPTIAVRHKLIYLGPNRPLE